MTYQPDEATLLRGLKSRARARDMQYASLMEMSLTGMQTAAKKLNVAFEGRTMHEIACDIIDEMYPEAHGDGSPAAKSDGVSDPNKFADTVYAQQATPQDRWHFRDVLGEGEPIEEPGDTWPVDVPEGMAGVGYKSTNGTIVPLDSEGSVMLSGWGPEQVRFLLVSLSQFFDGDYIKDFVLGLYVVMSQGDHEAVVDRLVAFLNEQNWLAEATDIIKAASELPTTHDKPSWAFNSQAAEYPVAGGPLDAPTEVLNTDDINQYKPEGY